MKIGVIGTGTIASAVVRGIAGDGHDIAVSERSAARAADLARAFDNVSVHDNAGVVAVSDVIFLGLMAEAAGEILAPLPFRAGQRVISFMAGASLEEVAAMVAPARAVAVMLPFPGIAVGGSPILVQGAADLARELFEPANRVYTLADDAELSNYLAAQAVLLPAVALVAEAAGWLAAQGSDADQGAAFLKHLVGSSLLASDLGPLMADLGTPGGYNARLRDHMEAAGMQDALREGLDRLAR